jgi:hypothetical protein
MDDAKNQERLSDKPDEVYVCEKCASFFPVEGKELENHASETGHNDAIRLAVSSYDRIEDKVLVMFDIK